MKLDIYYVGLLGSSRQFKGVKDHLGSTEVKSKNIVKQDNSK